MWGAVVKHAGQVCNARVGVFRCQCDADCKVVPVYRRVDSTGLEERQRLLDDARTEDRPWGKNVSTDKQVDVPDRFQPRQAALTLRTVAVTVGECPCAPIVEQGTQVSQSQRCQVIPRPQRQDTIAAVFQQLSQRG